MSTVQPLGLLAASLTSLLLVGCSSGLPGLTTGSTPSTPPAQAAPAPVKSTDRAMQVASVSAKATTCGYNFDPVRLRTTYLASETQAGSTPGEVAALEKLYDTTRARVTQTIGKADEFCGDEQTAQIKRDLVRHLAGDFTPPPKVVASSDWFGGSTKKAWDPKKAVFPNEVRD